VRILSNERATWLAANLMPHEPLLRSWLHRVKPAGLEADDLIQEAYAKVAELPSVAHITQPKPYLFQVVKSLILIHLRHAQVVPIETMAELSETSLSVDEASPERIYSGRQQLEQLMFAIEELPPGCRQVFELRKFEDLSQREIAAKLGISESTVEKQLARALRLLLDGLVENANPRQSIGHSRPASLEQDSEDGST
jgi:RNA polymerase sigma factor (sigma-70 family)